MVLKIVAVALATMLIVGVVLSGGWILVEAGKYVFNQHFSVGTAFAWAWQDYVNMIDIWDAFYRETAVSEYLFTNQHVDVVACTDL